MGGECQLRGYGALNEKLPVQTQTAHSPQNGGTVWRDHSPGGEESSNWESLSI